MFDGSNSEAPLLGTYCGTSAPKKVRSTSNVLLVTFFADGTKNGNGFHISFSQAGGRLIPYESQYANLKAFRIASSEFSC